MSRESSPFVDLSTELTVKILSLLLPDNVRALRYVIIACYRTDHKSLYTVAEQILNNQRTWLLDRFDKIYEGTQAAQTYSKYNHTRLKSITKSIVGRQYVKDTEVIHECDNWVSFLSTAGEPCLN